jgi:hypothetical protein
MKPFLFALFIVSGLCQASTIPEAYTFSYVGDELSGNQMHIVVVGSFTLNPLDNDYILDGSALTSFNMTLVESTHGMYTAPPNVYQLDIDDLQSPFILDITDNTLTMTVQVQRGPAVDPTFAFFHVIPNHQGQLPFPDFGPNIGSIARAPAPFILTPVYAPEASTYAMLGFGLIAFAACRQMRSFRRVRKVGG